MQMPVASLLPSPGMRADGRRRARGRAACASDWLVFVDRLGGAAPRMRVFSRRCFRKKTPRTLRNAKGARRAAARGHSRVYQRERARLWQMDAATRAIAGVFMFFNCRFVNVSSVLQAASADLDVLRGRAGLSANF